MKYVCKINVERICVSALSGENALMLIKENVEANEFKFCDYSLILMDCNMPVMDGY